MVTQSEIHLSHSQIEFSLLIEHDKELVNIYDKFSATLGAFLE